jgi:hypothetical protein
MYIIHVNNEQEDNTMKVKIDHIPTAKGVKFGFIGEDGCALSIGFRFSSVEACMKYAFKRGFEVTEIF